MFFYFEEKINLKTMMETFYKETYKYSLISAILLFFNYFH